MIEYLLQDNKQDEIGKFIFDKIKAFKSSVEYKKMVEGVEYYEQRNTTIMERQKEFFYAGRMYPDPYETNHKIPSGYLRKLIKQKVSYSINDGMTLSSETVDVDKLLTDLGRDFKKKLKAYAIEASKKGRAHFQTYIKDGKFNYKLINSEQIIVCYDEEEVDAIIHFYEKGEEKFAQLLTKASVSDWILKGDTYYLLGEIRPSIVLKTLVDGRIQGQTPESWGMMPITVTYNNDDKQTDLEPVRASIDIYDIINSDFANNLDDFQDVYWVLQGFQGESLEDFLKQVKQLKAIKVGEGGNAHMETIDIPVDARKTLMEITEDNIFKFGMGLNTEKIAGGSLTNVVIKARYADLDLKANDFEQEMKEGIYQLLDLLNVYYKITNQPIFTLDEIDITFDRSSLINQEELSRLANESLGKLSEETRLANDPRVTDVEMEVKAMEEIQRKIMSTLETPFGGD